MKKRKKKARCCCVQAEEQRHQRSILHLWTTATPQEAQLLPLEASLSRQIRQRSLRSCLQVWRVRFLFLVKLKAVYHSRLLGRWVDASAWLASFDACAWLASFDA